MEWDRQTEIQLWESNIGISQNKTRFRISTIRIGVGIRVGIRLGNKKAQFTCFPSSCKFSMSGFISRASGAMLLIWQETERRGEVSSRPESPAANRFPEFWLVDKQQMILPTKDILWNWWTNWLIRFLLIYGFLFLSFYIIRSSLFNLLL